MQQDSWSLVNLMLTIATTIAAAWMTISFISNKSESKKLFALIPAAGAIATFFLTQNLSSPIAMFDDMTWVLAAIALVQAGFILVTSMVKGQNGAN